MMLGEKLSNLTVTDDTFLQTHHHCIAQVIRNPPLPDCYLGSCSACPENGTLKKCLTSVLDDDKINIQAVGNC